jgi:hypothetical protein
MSVRQFLKTIVLVEFVRHPLTPDPEAAAPVREHRLKGRMLTWFDWGEYALWHLSPEIKISMDGPRETVYSDRLVSEHLRFYFGSSEESRYPDTLRVDYIWLPKALPVVPELEPRGWRTVFEGPLSVILARGRPDLPVKVVRVEPPVRPFPGP